MVVRVFVFAWRSRATRKQSQEYQSVSSAAALQNKQKQKLPKRRRVAALQNKDKTPKAAAPLPHSKTKIKKEGSWENFENFTAVRFTKGESSSIFVML